MFVTSLLAGVYVYVTLLRHDRRRTVLRATSRDHSQDDDVTVDTMTTIGGDLSVTTLDGNSNINALLSRTFTLSFP